MDNSFIRIKKKLLGSIGVVRLLGLSGLGKTRFVLESYRDVEIQDRYLYCNCQEHDTVKIKNSVNLIFQGYEDAIIILDNCDKELLGDIIKLKKSFNVGTKIITILNQPEENGSNCDGITYISMDDKYQEVVEMILKRFAALTDDQFQRIKDFSDGIPMMAELLVKGFQNGSEIGNLGDTQLMNKMLGCKADSDDRKVLQSLSLFNFVGHEGERRGEMQFVATTPSITSINLGNETLLMNLFDKVIQNYVKRTILEKRGRQIGVRPIPLAMYLVAEWLDNCTPERMLNVVTALQKSDFKKVLISEFHNQFKNMGFNSKAREILNKLMGEESPFGSAEVLNTEVGSHLFRTFVEVNPVAVSALLMRVFHSMSIDKLRNIVDGRRNLVWTLEKLCFDSRTFCEGAYLMMRFAIAENEKWVNNATGGFCRLFPLYLPATSASLEERLRFLQSHIENTENKPLVLSALRRALLTRDFIYMSGAEVQGVSKLSCYKPDDSAEIKEYIKGCLDLVVSEIRNHTDYADIAKVILESDVISLCMFRAAGIVIPYIEEMASIYENNWDKMQETLAFFEDRCKPVMSPDSQSRYKNLLIRLTKGDFASRFARVEKKSYNSDTRLDFDARLNQQRDKYKELAHEAYNDKLLTNENFKSIIKTECISSFPFGSELASMMSPDEQYNFISRYITFMSDDEKVKISILCDFVSNVGNELFNKILPVLMNARISYTTFACVGIRNIKPGVDEFIVLSKMIADGRAKISDYLQYWTRIRQDILVEDDLLKLFDEVLLHDDGFSVALKMFFNLLFGNRKSKFPKLTNRVADAIVEYHKSGNPLLNVENLILVVKGILLEGSRDEVARVMNESIIDYAKRSDNFFGHSYELEELYKVLMKQYFNAIWPSLSSALLADGEKFMTYYHLKELLGVDIIDDGKPIIMEGNHFEEFLLWCKAHPDTAPARLASMIQVANENDQFTPEALKLMELYADKDYVLDEIGCSLDSFSSVGSVVPYYERRKNIYSTLLQNPRVEVKEWAQKQINVCDYYIKRESIREEEGI